ncbi:M48 family metallopeptidase [Roseomonas marmotae]|uniref:M48 family metallopeptidase n=1 Tax=Roseomonas marmotae TaxID=2768161 RepID=A0ABS3KE82_9PROT|nr:M48 family metallopeptidase [Roseomonas marmotae]MBO1075769.1 M48 family metallopeptidase [Roseomonas marmotae]QTI80496.1 M48 family metallopeptidase [Roseomonas marmotae]
MTRIEEVPLGRRSCPVQWRISARARRVSLKIDVALGVVVITLPQHAPRQAGLTLLHLHAAWALAGLDALAPAVPLEDGAVVRLGDVPHAIRHEPGAGNHLEDGEIVVGGPTPQLRRRVLALLRGEAARRIPPRAARHAQVLGVSPRIVRLKDTRSRWGSCAPDGTLAFSWRLVMAPEWVMDYVVAHEVAHLREMNHSPRFWAQVKRLSPHRQQAHDWLRRHGSGLLRVG